MNPLQVVARTPKNNCGECGYPTCLAFAAAVVSTGVDPGNCPYINLDGLAVESSGIGLEHAAEERDLALIEHLKGKIVDVDLVEVAPAIGADHLASNGGVLRYSYLGQEVFLSRSGILLNGHEPEDPRDQILLYNYVHFGGGASPPGEWIGMESMPNSISKVRTLARYCEAVLAEVLSGRSHEVLTAKAGLAGGEPVDGGSASLAFEFAVLPMLPQRVLFWEEEPDDGFEAKVKVLYRSNALDYLDIESLLFSSERLAEKLRTLVSEGQSS